MARANCNPNPRSVSCLAAASRNLRHGIFCPSSKCSTFCLRALWLFAPECDDGFRLRFTCPVFAFATTSFELAEESAASASAIPLLPSDLIDGVRENSGDGDDGQQVDPEDADAQRVEDEELALVEAAEVAELSQQELENASQLLNQNEEIN